VGFGWSWPINSGENKQTKRVTLRSPSGFEVTVLDIGAALQSIVVPTSTGPLECILGYEDLLTYQSDPYYVGVTVGRFANRIRQGRTVVDAVEYQLDVNEATTGSCLHGGSGGFHRQRFALVGEPNSGELIWHLNSPAGDQGFPGGVSVDVIYRLIGELALSIEFVATADAVTVISLANHAYFNLDRQKSQVDWHHLRLTADRYTPVDEMAIPTGEIATVENTAFDLREMAPLRDRSFDHNFVAEGAAGKLRVMAELYSPESGVGLRVRSTQPGMQVYTGDFLDTPFLPRSGIALEAQNFPDAPNQNGFPSAILEPGDTYRQQTTYEFTLPG
jgi:aldose 1-epimerase